MSEANYSPKRGDVILVDFSPTEGHEQSGFRPALVLSPESYNRPAGLALVYPITSRQKGYPFEVEIPDGYGVSGVILSDCLRNIDWRARCARYVCNLPEEFVSEVLDRTNLLLRHD